jgi:hypothetical protein
VEIVIHRVNSLDMLNRLPPSFGAEIDIRAYRSELILNHEPFKPGCLFEDFLDQYQHGLLILNIKEAGIESAVLSLVSKYQIPDFFLLDVEFPYIYRASREGNRHIAIRYSEDEPIENSLKYSGKVDWVWIDTNSQLPLSSEICNHLSPFRTCLVCPERWARPQDIVPYRRRMADLAFEPNAVMTSLEYVPHWTRSISKG